MAAAVPHESSTTAMLRAFSEVRKEGEEWRHGARPGSSRARRASSPAYKGGPAAASTSAASTPGSPIARLRTSSATPATRSRIGSAASATNPGTPTGTRNAPRSPRSASRDRTSAADSRASAALYSSTSPASSPPNGNSANTEYTTAETSTALRGVPRASRSEEHTSELQSRLHLVCRLLLEKKKIENIALHHAI